MIPNIIRNKLPPVDYDRIAFIAEHYEEMKHAKSPYNHQT